jgi:hypothetical protein
VLAHASVMFLFDILGPFMKLRQNAVSVIDSHIDIHSKISILSLSPKISVLFLHHHFFLFGNGVVGCVCT